MNEPPASRPTPPWWRRIFGPTLEGALLGGALLSLLNGVLALIWPAVHGEAEPIAMSTAGLCMDEWVLGGVGPMLGCVRDSAINYGWGYYLASTLVGIVFGEHYPAAVLLTSASMWLGLVGCFLLGRELGRRAGHAEPGRVGRWAWIAYLAFPIIPYLGRRVQFDGFLAALTGWFLWALLKSEGLTRRAQLGRWFGVMAAVLWVGLLTKPSIAFFTLPAAGVAWLVAVARRKEEGVPSRFQRGLTGVAGLVGLVLVMGAAVAFYRYVSGQWNSSVSVADSMSADRLTLPPYRLVGRGPMRWLSYLWFYPRMLINYQAGWLLTAAIGVIAVNEARAKRWWSLVVGAAYVLGGLIHTVLPYQKFYYTTVGLPALAGLLGLGAAQLARRPEARAAWVLRGLCAATLWLALSQHLGVPGPARLLPARAQSIAAFNRRPGYQPEPALWRHLLGRDIPLMMAFAEKNEGQVEWATFAFGDKLDWLLARPDVYSFNHLLTYEMERRGVEYEVHPGGHGLWPRTELVFMSPPAHMADFAPEGVERACVAELEAYGDPNDRSAYEDCRVAAGDFARYLSELQIIHISGISRGHRRMLAVHPENGGMTPWLALRAIAYAESMGEADQISPVLVEWAGRASEEERRRSAETPLRYIRPRGSQRLFPW